MHPLLISEQPNLRLTDLLAIESTTTNALILNGRAECDNDKQIPKSPLMDIMQYPVYIPQLFMRIQIGLTNAWNEFKSKYDPYVGKLSIQVVTSMPTTSTTSNVHPAIDDRKLPSNDTIAIETMPQLFASLVISYVTIASDFYKGFYATKHHPMIKLKFLNSLINREVKNRNISWDVLFNVMCTTLNPIRIAKVWKIVLSIGEKNKCKLIKCFILKN